MSESSRLRVRETPYGRALAAVPGAKDALAAFSAALWSEDGATPLTTRELVFLRTSIVNRCEA